MTNKYETYYTVVGYTMCCSCYCK